MTSPTPAVQLAWARLIRAHSRALGAIEGDLRQAGLPSLEWYDVLWELERGGPMRPRDLQARLLLAQYNLSRLLERMCAAGQVERRPCPEDRRGHLVAATPEGWGMRQRMWPVYARGIQNAVGERVSEADALALAELLNPIACPVCIKD